MTIGQRFTREIRNRQTVVSFNNFFLGLATEGVGSEMAMAKLEELFQSWWKDERRHVFSADAKTETTDEDSSASEKSISTNANK